MTWGEFKKAVEDQAVTDQTPVDYIDWDGSSHVCVQNTSGTAVCIW